MKTLLIVLVVIATFATAEEFDKHSFTISGGIPGLVLPELGYEYGIDASNKIGVSAGMIVLWPEYRLNYTRMISSFELMGSLGYVPAADDSEDNFIGEIFEEILSAGTEGCKFVSATAGYRYTADSGFIFRTAAGGALFIGDDDTATVPFFQLGIGYGF